MDKFYIMDIRYPNKDIQNNLIEINSRINGKKNMKLSSLIEICKNEFGFDNVVILDFACRVRCDGIFSYSRPSNTLEDIYSERSIDVNQIESGRKMLNNFKLGGKLSRRNLSGRKLSRRKLSRRKLSGRKLAKIFKSKPTRRYKKRSRKFSRKNKW